MNINSFEKMKSMGEKSNMQYKKPLKNTFNDLKDVEKIIEKYERQQKRIVTNVQIAYNLTQKLAEKIPINIDEVKKQGKTAEDLFDVLCGQKNDVNKIAFENEQLITDNYDNLRKAKHIAVKNVRYIENLIVRYKDGRWSKPKIILKYCKELKNNLLKNIEKLEKAYITTKNDESINKNVKILKMFDDFIHPACLRRRRVGAYFPKYLKDYMFAKQKCNLMCFDDTSMHLAKSFEDKTNLINKYECKDNKVIYENFVDIIETGKKGNPQLYNQFEADFRDLEKSKTLFNKSITQRIKKTSKLLTEISTANERIEFKYMFMFQKPSVKTRLKYNLMNNETMKDKSDKFGAKAYKDYSNLMFNMIVATQVLENRLAKLENVQRQDLASINKNYLNVCESLIKVIEKKDPKLETTSTLASAFKSSEFKHL